jgi:DNA excision repair protein ERCC-4
VADVIVTIVADAGELRSGVPDALRALGVSVDVASLPAGDYLVGDAVAVERKTVADLHRSIANGRLWSQLLSCRRELDRTFLLVEGRPSTEAASRERGSAARCSRWVIEA